MRSVPSGEGSPSSRGTADAPSPRRRWRWLAVLFALCAIGAGVLALLRPWTDCTMTVEVCLLTDRDGLTTSRRSVARFSPHGESRPVIPVTIDLASLEGQLVLLQISGDVRRGGSGGQSAGYVTCAAEVADPKGTHGVEFVGWHPTDMTPHGKPAGVQSFLAETPEDRRFSYTRSGPLWHVLRVPPQGRLSVLLRPVLFTDLERAPEPLVPLSRQDTLHPPQANTAPSQPPDVFIYLIDALRADHLGCYGYSRPTSPAIDSFSSGATLYESAHATTSWTRPSVASLLTGLYPPAHQVVLEANAASAELVFLPEVLQDHGYRTTAVCTNGHVCGAYGFEQGYDRFIFEHHLPADEVNQRVSTLLADHPPERPLFLFVHTLEPHSPYAPRPESRRLFDRGIEGSCDGTEEALLEAGCLYPNLSPEDIDHLVDLYDAEIFDGDQAFGEFLDLLRRAGRFDNSLIVFMADHGEAFGEHDTLQHRLTLNREVMRVPLIIRFPGDRGVGTRVKGRVILTDLFPTILREVGIRHHVGHPLSGVDLSPSSVESEAASRPEVFAGLAWEKDPFIDVVGVIDKDGYKRVLELSRLVDEAATESSVGLWDTRADPEELTDLSDAMPVRAAYGEQLIAEWLASERRWRESRALGPPPSGEVTPELRKQLQALGYL